MEVLRRAPNPWGQEVLLGIGWDLFWLALFAGFAFVVVHTLLILRLRRRGGDGSNARQWSHGSHVPAADGVPARVVRHNLASRIFHWSMALTMFALLITAFVPVMGLQFDWVTVHWIAGLALIATVLFHIVHATFFQNLRAIWVGVRDVREAMGEFRHLVGIGGDATPRAGKYPVGNKLYHHAVTVATLAAIVTGLVMMVRIDTPLFAQNQYLLGDATWGWVYVIHGVSGVALVLMVIAHVYFAIRPEKRWQTRSMIKGWITADEFATHHDPERWPLPEGPPSPDGEGVSPPPAVSHST